MKVVWLWVALLSGVSHAGSLTDGILVVGGGPTALMSAVLLQEKLLPQVGRTPQVVVMANRLTTVPRLRQVVILKKSYGLVQRFAEIPGLKKHLAPYIECVLPTVESKDFREGPYSCLPAKLFASSKFEDSEQLAGVTITLANLETALLTFIEKRYGGRVKIIPDTFRPSYLQSLKRVLVIGASGALGALRSLYKQGSWDTLAMRSRLESSNAMEIDGSYFESTTTATERDGYMAILRYPVRIPKGFDFDSDLSFGTPLVTRGQADHIKISSYVDPESLKYRTPLESKKEGRLAYRQIYYSLDFEGFRSLSDCGFWNACSLADYFQQRLRVFDVLRPGTASAQNLVTGSDAVFSTGEPRTKTHGWSDIRLTFKIHPPKYHYK